MDYPKYQISIFHDSNRNLQSVFRTDDKEEYLAQLEVWKNQNDIEATFGGSPEEHCPKCNGKLVEQVTKTGKRMKKCENNKWDFKLKKATGCDFVQWI